MFLTPVKGAATREAAQSGSLAPAKNIATLKVEWDDEAGLGGRISTAIADAGINLRGVSAAVIDKRFVAYFGFDSAAGRDKSGSRTKNPGESKESRERQALIRDRGGLFGVVAAIVQKFTLSRSLNGLLESFFARKLPKRDSR